MSKEFNDFTMKHLDLGGHEYWVGYDQRCSVGEVDLPELVDCLTVIVYASSEDSDRIKEVQRVITKAIREYEFKRI